MIGKKVFRIFIISFAGIIITGIFSIIVWYLIFSIFPPGFSSGGFIPITFSSKENLTILVLILAGVALPSGLAIGLAVSFMNLTSVKAAIGGALTCFAVPMMFLLIMGAGDSTGFGKLLLTLLIPQMLIGAASGLFISFLSETTRRIMEE